jgi:outer membrane protein
MRTKTALLALVTIAASALPLGAAQAQAKIGVVNVARLLQEAPQAQAASQALDSEFATRKRDLQTMERDLKTREDRLQKDGATMAEAERRNQEKALRDGQRDFARKQNELMEDFNVRRNEALGQLQRTVLVEVQSYAKSAGLDLVVADVLYASTAVDITPQVLAALQAKGKSAAPAKP